MAELKTLSKDTAISLGLLIVVIAAVASAASWASIIDVRLANIEEALAEGTGDRWTASDMRAWIRAANKEVEIWSKAAEQELGLEPGTWHVFEFPDPDLIRGDK